MPREEYYPDEPVDHRNLQRWGFFSRQQDGKEIAFAYGILIAPPGSRDEVQKIMFLPPSTLRITPGESDPRRAEADRLKMIALGVIQSDVLVRPVVFPSFSRACDVLIARSVNGWTMLRSVDDYELTLDKAHALDQQGSYSLIYYRDPPEDAHIIGR